MTSRSRRSRPKSHSSSSKARKGGKHRSLPIEAGPVLGWAVTVWLGVIMLFSTWMLGGWPSEVMVHVNWMVAVLLVLHGLWLLTRKQQPLRLNPWGFVFLPFFAYAVFSFYFITPAPWRAERELLNWAQFIIVFWVTLHTVRTRPQFWTLVGMLSGAALVSLMAGCYQYFFDPDWLALAGRPLAEQYVGRSSGTFGCPNSFAALMLVSMGVLWVVALMRKVSAPMRLLCGYLGVLCVVGVVMSISRGGLIGVAVMFYALPFFVTHKLRTRVYSLIGVSAVLLASAVSIYFSMDDVRARIDRIAAEGGEVSRRSMWKSGWEMFTDHPALGSGISSYQTLWEPYRADGYQAAPLHTHNDYLNVLSDYGTLGFVLLFGAMGAIILRSWARWRREEFLHRPKGERRRTTPEGKLILGGLLLGLLGFSIHLFVDFHLHIPVLLFWVAISLALMLRELSARSLKFPEVRLWSSAAAGLAVLLAGWLTIAGSQSFIAATYYKSGDIGLDRFVNDFDDLRYEDDFLQDVITDFGDALAHRPGHADALARRGFARLQLYFTNPRNARSIGEEALADINAALAINDEIWDYHAYRAMALTLTGARPEAVEGAYLTSLALTRDNAAALYYYAYFLSTQRERKEEALKVLEACLELDPAKSDALSLRDKLQI